MLEALQNIKIDTRDIHQQLTTYSSFILHFKNTVSAVIETYTSRYEHSRQ